MARRTQEEKYRDAKDLAVAWAKWSKERPTAKEKAFEAAKNSPIRFVLGDAQYADTYSDYGPAILDTSRFYDSTKDFWVICWCDNQDDSELILSALNKVYKK